MLNFISANELEETINNVFSPKAIRNNGTIHLNKKYGDVKINYFSTGNGITYSSFMGKFHSDTKIEGSSKEDMSFISFNTAAGITLENRIDKNKCIFNANQCWQGKHFKEEQIDGIYTKNKHYISHHITFDNTLFEKISLSNNERQQQKIPLVNDCISIYQNDTISNKQKILLRALESSTHITDNFQNLYLESKILDLAYITVNNLPSPHTSSNKIFLSPQDILSLEKAKDIILSDMSNPPSLKELAHKIATNEFKLKKGFKQLFGNTVYGLLQEHRLQESKILLENNDINVSEAAALVGYKSIGHFSKIFKENFGILASDIIKSRKYYY